MVDISQQVGIGLIIIACILALLFICPKSPVRKKWWSASGKLAITLADDSKVGVSVDEGNIIVRVGLIAIPSIQVDKITLRIGRMKPCVSDWKPMEVKAVESRYINFQKPSEISKGCYNARLCAYTPDGYSKSNKFSLEIYD
jgi:hypothetical protein